MTTAGGLNQSINNYSLSEIQGTCKKAARGAGMSWGMAEEAGMIAKTLTKLQINGPACFVPYFKWLENNFDQCTRDMRCLDGVWSRLEGEFCPLHAGMIVADRAYELKSQSQSESKSQPQSKAFKFQNLICPSLLLGQLYLVAKHFNYTLQYEFEGGVCLISADGLQISDEALSQLLALKSSDVGISKIEEEFSAHHQVQNLGCGVSANDWDYLQSLAANTYAPESEESRLSGAGAGLQDND